MTAVAIVGMHRSGTSLLASWMHQCGVVIADRKLLGAAAGNDEGHWEDYDIYQLQRRSIARQQGDGSAGWLVTEGKPLRFSLLERARARALARRRQSRYGLWGWKDPRTILFLDEWVSIVPDLRVVAVWRPARQVAASLVRRSEKAGPAVTEQLGMQLWEAHNELLVRFLEQHPDRSVLFSVDQMVTDTSTVQQRIASIVDGLEPAELPMEQHNRFEAAPLVHPIERDLQRLSEGAS